VSNEFLGALISVLGVIVIPSVAGIFKTHSRLQQVESDIKSLQGRVDQTERKHSEIADVLQRLVRIETLVETLIKRLDHEKL
jgi:hypothetical protein